LVSTVSKVRSLSHSLGITDADIAFAFGVRARSVQRWWSGESRPSYERERRLLEFAYVLDELQKVLKPDAARDWLMAPNRELDHDSPAERVARGDYRRVLELVDAMADGVFV
jgi:putative toxin-antitoxin system antitoxin component (TIGR02293 family)